MTQANVKFIAGLLIAALSIKRVVTIYESSECISVINCICFIIGIIMMTIGYSKLPEK